MVITLVVITIILMMMNVKMKTDCDEVEEVRDVLEFYTLVTIVPERKLETTGLLTPHRTVHD